MATIVTDSNLLNDVLPNKAKFWQEVLYAKAPSEEVSLFLNNISDVNQVSARSTLFRVFDVLDSWMGAGKFEHCNDALSRAPLENLPNEVALGFLSMTKPAKNQIPARQAFVARLKLLYLARGLDEKTILELLGGLE